MCWWLSFPARRFFCLFCQFQGKVIVPKLSSDWRHFTDVFLLSYLYLVFLSRKKGKKLLEPFLFCFCTNTQKHETLAEYVNITFSRVQNKYLSLLPKA